MSLRDVGLHKDHPRYIAASLRHVAGITRGEEQQASKRALTQLHLSEACRLIARHLDSAADVIDPLRPKTLPEPHTRQVLASMIEDMRQRAEIAKARDEHEAFDMFSDVVTVLESAYERTQARVAATNGKIH